MPVEAVLRILLVQFPHYLITVDFGEDGGGGDGETGLVPLYHPLMLLLPSGDGIAIEQTKIRGRFQAGHSSLHRQTGCNQDIPGSNFLHRSDAYRPTKRAFFNSLAQPLSLQARENLGIGDAGEIDIEG
jgi:hypothetical protein